MNALLALGQNAFEWTWKTSASAALLVALVFLAQKLLSRWLTPRLRYTLSLLILIRLLIPMVPSSPLSWENLFPRRAAPKESASALIPPPPATQEANPAPPPGISPGISPAVFPAIRHVPAPLAPALSVRARISLAWAGGFFCLMTLAAWRYRQWIRLVAQGQTVSDPHLLELLDSARQDMGVRPPVTLVSVARLGSPAVFGCWRIRLLLPQSAAEQLSARELRMVFLHEMAHVRRHDAALNFLLLAVQFLHWFNPLVWLANHWIRSDRELVCDAMTLSRLPAAERPLYGQVLLKLMDGISAETPVFPGVVPVVGSKQQIKRRLIMIKHHGQGSIGGGLATALAVAALACATFTRAEENTSVEADWMNWNNGQSIGSFYAVAGTAKETVAVGIDGLIATRNNATGVWTTQTFTGDPDFRAIVYAQNQYVIVREEGFIMTSPDGLKWTSRASPTKKNLLGLFWDGHQYLAGGDGGTILSSPDGIKWTSRDSGSQINFYSFSDSGARYVAVGNDGIRISKDSVRWTAPANAPSTVPFTACTWTGREFLACGLGLDKNPTIYTSPDGDVWTLRDTTIKASLRAAITIKGAIYIAGDSVIEKSTDGGATWTDTYINVGGNKLFMGLASNGKDLIAAGFNHNVWAMPLSGRPAVKGRLELPVGRGAPQIGMGYWHGIILASDGSLWAWGQNGDGWPVLGLGSLHASRKSLRQIGHDTDWVSIAVGHSHNLAIKSDGTLWGWGANFRHQLDATTNVARATPVPSAPGNDWKQAAAGAVHSLAIKKDGTLWAWGNNWAGQLGTGTVTDSPAPVQVGSANDWTRIWAKGVVSVGQRSDGSLWRWGILDGFRTNDGLLVPTRVSADTNWVDVSFGDSEVFAIQSDGTLWVWGREAQIYTGATDTRANTIPTRVGTDNDWMACAPAHGYYQVLMKKDGSLWALDATADHNPKGGVLTAAKLERIDLPGSFMAVAAGQDGIGVALKGIGEVWTWGWVADKPWQLSNIDPKNQPTEN